MVEHRNPDPAAAISAERSMYCFLVKGALAITGYL